MKKVIVLILAVLMAGVCSCAWAVMINGTVHDAHVGDLYSELFSPTGYVIDYGSAYGVIYLSWSSSGSVPPGLEFRESGRGLLYWLEGYPTKAGEYTFYVSVRDWNDSNRATNSDRIKYTVIIEPAEGGGDNNNPDQPDVNNPGQTGNDDNGGGSDGPGGGGHHSGCNAGFGFPVILALAVILKRSR